MNRITIDTAELRALARDHRAQAGLLVDLHLDLVRAWAPVHRAAYPGLAGLGPMAEEIAARLAGLAASVDEQARTLDAQATRAETNELLGDAMAQLFGLLGPLFGAAAALPVRAWSPVPSLFTPVARPPAAPLPLPGFGALAGIPGLGVPSTGFGALDPLAALGRQNGAVAPIAGLLGEVDKIIADPLGLGGRSAQVGSLATGVPSLQQLELSTLQGNINRIMAGGSFPGSDVLATVRTGVQGLFPGGVSNFLAGVEQSARANGTFRPGANPAALMGVLESQRAGSEAIQGFFESQRRSLTDPILGALDGDGFLTKLRAQGQAASASTLVANISSQLGLPLP